MGVTAVHPGLPATRLASRSSSWRRWRVPVVVILAAAAVAACDGSFEADGVVQITPNPPIWVGAPPFEASATIQQVNGEPIPDTFTVAAEVTWATPPGQEPVRRTVTAFKMDDGSHRVAGIDARSAQMVTVVWEVTGTDGQGLAESEPVEVQVDCPSGPEPYLQSMQAAVTGLVSGPGTIDEDGLKSAGYLLNNHGWAQIPGGGVSFVSLANAPIMNVNAPPLLLLTAPEGADITDTNADTDLTLAGWGYASAKLNDERPTLGCVPFHLWSVHEAGWHTPDDGGMVLDDGTAQSADAAAARGGNRFTYHPRLWDIHFWLEPGSDIPSSSLVNMTEDGELIPVDGGAVPPDGMFFFPPFPVPAGAD